MDNSEDKMNPAVEQTEKVEKVEAPSLKELLPEDMREVKALQSYDSVEAMAKSLLNAQELVGKRVEDLTPEQLAKIKPDLVAPESIEGYDFEAEKEVKEHALSLGLNKAQAQKFAEASAKQREEMEKAVSESKEKAIKDIEEMFGSKYEASMDMAQKAALELGGDELVEGVFGENGSLDPKLIKALSEAGKRLFDHESVQVASTPPMNIEEINVEISKMYTKDNRRILGDPAHPSHRAVKDKLMSLYEKKTKLKG